MLPEDANVDVTNAAASGPGNRQGNVTDGHTGKVMASASQQKSFLNLLKAVLYSRTESIQAHAHRMKIF